VVPTAFVTHIGNEIVAGGGRCCRRLRGAEVAHVQVFDREIDDCGVLFAAVLCVPHEAFGVHDDVWGQAGQGVRGATCRIKTFARKFGNESMWKHHLVRVYRLASPEISSFSVTPSNLRSRVTRGTCEGKSGLRGKVLNPNVEKRHGAAASGEPGHADVDLWDDVLLLLVFEQRRRGQVQGQ
jgi:hypothetical protein